MAERNGVDLRRELSSADLFKERAIAAALLSLNTPDFKSIALLLLVTLADHLPTPVGLGAPFVRREDFEWEVLVAMVSNHRRCKACCQHRQSLDKLSANPYFDIGLKWARRRSSLRLRHASGT
jgi:hypothetical protein